MMSLKSTLPLLKLSTIAFASMAIVYIVKYYDVQKKVNKLEHNILIDKKTYSNDLKEIFRRYDAEVLKNKNFNEAKSVVLNDNTNFKKNTPVYIHIKDNKVIGLLPINKFDSLNVILSKQIEENSELNNQIASLTLKNKELQKINSSNESIVSNSKNLTAVNVVANGIKIISNNIIETKRFNAMEQIKVCFTLVENKAAVKGNKDIYIQIVNPKNKIVCKNGETYEMGDRLLHYSAKTNIYYDNEETDVCVFVDPNRADMLKGDYEINIFSGITLIGNSVFSLK